MQSSNRQGRVIFILLATIVLFTASCTGDRKDREHEKRNMRRTRHKTSHCAPVTGIVSLQSLNAVRAQR